MAALGAVNLVAELELYLTGRPPPTIASLDSGTMSGLFGQPQFYPLGNRAVLVAPALRELPKRPGGQMFQRPRLCGQVPSGPLWGEHARGHMPGVFGEAKKHWVCA